jgi:hypothetical protein
MDGYAPGTASCDTITVTVSNVAPTVEAGADQIIYEGDVLHLDPATFSDPGFDCPGCVPPTEENFAATIDWGDGSPAETVLPENLLEIPGCYVPLTGEYAPTNGEVAGSHPYLAGPGVYPLSVCITDDDGDQGCDTLEVIVAHGFMRYCTYANQDVVEIGEGVQVACSLGGEGFLELMRDSQVDGDVVGRGDILVGQRAHVGGDAKAAGTVTLKKDGTVEGDIVSGASLPYITQVSVGVSACKSDVTVTPGDTTTLDEGGCYGKLKVKQDATLKLKDGQYAFESIEAGKNASLVFELPPGKQIVIDVAGTLHLEEGVIMVAGPGSTSDILFRVAGSNVKLGKDGTFLGTFIAPEANIDQHPGTELRGLLYGRQVQLQKDALVIGEPALDLFIDLFVR